MHARERIAADFEDAKKELMDVVSLIKTDEDFIASVELIDNYQDKENYNDVLLDEEKKLLANYLLQKIKSSFNDSAKIYDKNAELIAHVYKKNDEYILNFIAYENTKKFLYSKLEREDVYQKQEYKENSIAPYKHVDYYKQPELEIATLTTYHYEENKIYITSHGSLFSNDKRKRSVVHVEMTKLFDDSYFEKISHELNVKFLLSEEQIYKEKSTKLFEKVPIEEKNLVEHSDDYMVAFGVSTVRDSAYILVFLEKNALNDALNENRRQLLEFIFIAIIIITILFNVLIHFGISKPIEKLMGQISRIKDGSYDEQTSVKTADELEEISKNINMLAIAVAHRENSLRDSKNKLEYLSTHDELTQLYNRRSFSMKLEYALQIAHRNKTKIAVLFLDLDEFKQVNDTLGHTVGDTLLQAVASRLYASLRESDVLARVGGDEFNLFVDGFKNITELQIFVQKILDDFQEPFVDTENEIITSASIGIAIYPDDGKDSETLIKNADLAMYKAKGIGKNTYSFYSLELSNDLQKRMNIVQMLKSAIKNKKEFLLYYQPKISIKTKKLVGVEALIRWNNPELGFVRPDQFIPIAEDTHMIIDIGDWVIHQACNDFVALKNEGYNIGQVSVNISGVQLQYSDMFKTLEDAIGSSGIKTKELELEITESYIASNVKSAIETLMKFRSMGIDIAIDDFGTGYSSMSQLHALPISRLKIDKAFVDDLPNSKESVAVVNAIIALAESFELKITVEGVELEEQLNFFEDKYCDDVQGYYYSQPLSLEELKVFVNHSFSLRNTNEEEC